MKDIQADIYETITNPHDKSMKAEFGLFPNKPIADMPGFPWRSAREFNWAVRIDHTTPLGFGARDWPQFVDWINELDANFKERGLLAAKQCKC